MDMGDGSSSFCSLNSCFCYLFWSFRQVRMFFCGITLSSYSTRNEYFPIHKFILSTLQNRSNSNDSSLLKNHSSLPIALPIIYQLFLCNDYFVVHFFYGEYTILKEHDFKNRKNNKRMDRLQ